MRHLCDERKEQQMRAKQKDSLVKSLGNPISRRGALRGLGAGVATALAIGASDRVAATAAASQPPLEPEAGAWKT
jgi:hypothetical protein